MHHAPETTRHTSKLDLRNGANPAEHFDFARACAVETRTSHKGTFARAGADRTLNEPGFKTPPNVDTPFREKGKPFTNSFQSPKVTAEMDENRAVEGM